jgi:hypothetical protein
LFFCQHLNIGGFGYVFLVQDERGSMAAIKQFPINAREQMTKAKEELEIWVQLYLQYRFDTK